MLAIRTHTRPGTVFFERELEWLLGRDREWLEETAREYRGGWRAWRYLSSYRSSSARSDGIAKTLDVAEGFAAWALIKHLRPRVVVELGTQNGISARLWKEALKAYVPGHQLYLCDLEDRRLFIGDDEAIFLRGDARETLVGLFASRSIDLLFNDAHPYGLIRWSVEQGLERGVKAFAFHDVGCEHRRGPYRSESSKLPASDRLLHGEEYSRFGHWERHVMAELFSPEILNHNSVVMAPHRIQIFDSLFGFGVALREEVRAVATSRD
jgi:hypothetical protein